ncbi:MAG TPA: hypothetical protein VGD62_01520 [Acidobacteriaceae bacterium]
MRPVVWFRVAALLMLLFAAGHTYGFLAFRPATAEGQAVWRAMNEVRAPAGRATFSYGDFYRGFGLSITVSQLFSAWLAWWLSHMAARAGQPGYEGAAADAGAIAWALFAVQCAGIVLAWRYFSAGPAVLSALAAVCFALGAISLRGAGVRRPARAA